MVSFADSPLFANAPISYSVVDVDGRILAANTQFWELFRHAEGTELTVADITHDVFQAETSDYFDQIRDGSDVVAVEKLYVRSDESVFWGRLTARRVEGEDGETLLIGVIEDIDEERSLQAGLRNAAHQQSEFVAQVSHELRNPLHTIAGMAELLTDAGLDTEHRQQAEVILREARSLSSIVSDLLDIGRIDAGNFDVDLEPFALRELVDRSARGARKPAASKGLDFSAKVSDRAPIHVLGDRRRVGQILDNLIGNAIKFTESGSVDVRVELDESRHVLFRVTDTGPGIPQDFVADLFEPFRRVNESTSGAGLGLAISRRLAESMGGSLEVASTGSEGTCFELTLPLEATKDVPEGRAGLPTASDSRNVTVLVVEDNPETQMLAAAQLKRLGYESEVVGDGFAALEVSDEKMFGAILMDWHLPGMDGLETTRRFRQREEREGRERTPIISVTARAMAADIAACRDAGADDFVAKPASISAIGEALERWTVGDGAPLEAEVETDKGDELFVDLLDQLGDPATVKTLGETFLGELPDRIAAIVEVDDDGENRVELVAHALKSTSAMFGADELSAIARDIEETARGDATVTDEQRQRLTEIADQTTLAFAQALESLNGDPS